MKPQIDPKALSGGSNGAEGDRTLNLCIANTALSQIELRPRRGHCAGQGAWGQTMDTVGGWFSVLVSVGGYRELAN